MKLNARFCRPLAARQRSKNACSKSEKGFRAHQQAHELPRPRVWTKLLVCASRVTSDPNGATFFGVNNLARFGFALSVFPLLAIACTTSEELGFSGTPSGSATTGVGGDGGGAGGAGQGGTAGHGQGGVDDPGPSTFAIFDLDHHRNRLLDTFLARRAAADRCKLWTAMTTVEKGVFLTHTDMLGHRSCMESSSVPANQLNGGACSALECTCTTGDGCNCPVGSEMGIDHIFKIWAVNGTDTSCCSGTDCCNGGGEWHRTFFSADDKLIGYFRNIHSGLPEWAESNDFAGPHDPFTQSSETQQDTPRGQTHFFAKDTDSVVLSRNGVEGVSDPHIVEIDNDYNFWHDSNPEGTYLTTYGRAVYKRAWNGSGSDNRGDGLPTTFLGNGAPGDISEIASDKEWLPTCGPSLLATGVTNEGGKPLVLASGKRVIVTGSGFSAKGNRVHVRSRTMAVALDASSPLFFSESFTKIEFQLPKDIGVGEGFVYVEASGVLTNLIAVTIL